MNSDLQLIAGNVSTDVPRALAAGIGVTGITAPIDITTPPGAVNTVYTGGRAILTVKRIAGTAAGLGANNLGIAVAGKQIIPLYYTLNTGAAITVIWKSATTGTTLGTEGFTAAGFFASGHCPNGHFATVAGEDLQLSLSLALPVNYRIVYVEM